jgi:hypothetical protein
MAFQEPKPVRVSPEQQAKHAEMAKRYEARLVEEGWPARKAHADAARIVRDRFNERGEPRQPHGTLDVKEYARRTIDAYRDRAALVGPAAAKSSTVYAVATTAEANGVNGTRAARVASASISEYERLGAKGAPHDLARNAAARRMAERYDQHAQDRQRQQGRDRGMER